MIILIPLKVLIKFFEEKIYSIFKRLKNFYKTINLVDLNLGFYCLKFF